MKNIILTSLTLTALSFAPTAFASPRVGISEKVTKTGSGLELPYYCNYLPTDGGCRIRCLRDGQDANNDSTTCLQNLDTKCPGTNDIDVTCTIGTADTSPTCSDANGQRICTGELVSN